MRHTTSAIVITLILALAGASATPPPADAKVPIDGASFAKLAEAVKPAVINVTTETKRTATREGAPDELFRRFFGDRRDREPVRGVGSGVIIDPSGIALTNAHVVDRATQVEVTLPDGSKHPAEVAGSDKKTDLAVIRIKANGKKFAALPLGDSDKAQVGDWVIAVGSPFGLQATVTSGIISAKARHIGAGPYDDFLQTDAAINPGNSGGPLVNMAGEIVGINTAIVAGGSGIGFAIPSNMARRISGELLAKGSVTRGWLGVSLQPVTPDLAKSFGREKGALVSDVSADSPADKAGVQPGDIVTKIDGKPVDEPSDVARVVGFAEPGKQASVTVWRDGKERTLTVTLGQAPSDREQPERRLGQAPDNNGRKERTARLGLDVQPMTAELAQRLGVETKDGVVITAVEPKGPGADAGLRPGDIIKEIDRQPVKTVADFDKFTRDAKKPLAFRVQRGDSARFVAVTPSAG